MDSPCAILTLVHAAVSSTQEGYTGCPANGVLVAPHTTSSWTTSPARSPTIRHSSNQETVRTDSGLRHASWRTDPYSVARRSLLGLGRNSRRQFGHVLIVHQLHRRWQRSWGGGGEKDSQVLKTLFFSHIHPCRSRNFGSNQRGWGFILGSGRQTLIFQVWWPQGNILPKNLRHHSAV